MTHKTFSLITFLPMLSRIFILNRDNITQCVFGHSTSTQYIIHSSSEVASVVIYGYLVSGDTLLALYDSIIYSYLTYCIEIWSNTYKTNIFSLLAKHKKIVRITCNANYLDDTAPLRILRHHHYKIFLH